MHKCIHTCAYTYYIHTQTHTKMFVSYFNLPVLKDRYSSLNSIVLNIKYLGAQATPNAHSRNLTNGMKAFHCCFCLRGSFSVLPSLP